MASVNQRSVEPDISTENLPTSDEKRRTLIIFGGQDCRHYTNAIKAATLLAKKYPEDNAPPTCLGQKTMAEYQEYIADRSNLPNGFKDAFPETHLSSPACFVRTSNGEIKFIGGYDKTALAINLYAGGGLIAPQGRKDKMMTTVATVIFIAHVLLMYFLNPQPVSWRWTVSQTGTFACFSSAQLLWSTCGVIAFASILKGRAPKSASLRLAKMLVFSFVPPWLFAAVFTLVVPEYAA